VTREQFEARVLELWMSTRIPLTRAHVQYHTGVPRQRLNKWLDELTGDGVLEFDVDDDGEMMWKVPGAARASDGPRTFAEMGKRGGAAGSSPQPGRALARREEPASKKKRGMDEATDELASLGRAAMTLANRSRPPARATDESDNKKSLLVSAGLSFLGPLGWLYAGSLREALPAAAIAILIAAVVPTFLLMPILWLAMPLSAVVGLVYAWQYNRQGERVPLFLDDKKKE